MIPYILAAVGGYLIGDSLKGKQFAEGGMMAKGGKTDKTKTAFGLLTFEQLEEIFGVKLFGLEYEEEEELLDELRKEWNSMSKQERKEILEEYIGDSLKGKQYAEGGMMARGGLTGRDKKLLDAGFRLTIITDMYNHKIIIEKNKKTNKIEYIVIEGDIFSKHKKLKEFDTESEAFSYLSTKAGRKVKQAVD